MTDLHKITIAEARSRLRKKEITSRVLSQDNRLRAAHRQPVRARQVSRQIAASRFPPRVAPERGETFHTGPNFWSSFSSPGQRPYNYRRGWEPSCGFCLEKSKLCGAWAMPLCRVLWFCSNKLLTQKE